MNQTEVTQYDNLDQLQTMHHNLESRLAKLDRHRSLSPEEQYEKQVIKKRKLALKDKINQMQARY